MAEVNRRIKRYRKKDSDRSGFTFIETELVLDGGVLVGPSEYDMPPPSNIPIGGEGDISPGDTRSDYTSTATPAGKDFTTNIVTAAGGIPFQTGNDNSGTTNTNLSWIYVAGNTVQVDITANPQITSAYQNAIITVQCVSNTIILENCNGLATMGGTLFVMRSGSLINFIYSQTDNLWHEMSRIQ